MNVVCIDNCCYHGGILVGKNIIQIVEDDKGSSLTLNKVYDAIKKFNYYLIINDDRNEYLYDKECYYLKECFKSLSEIRNEKINKLLAE